MYEVAKHKGNIVVCIVKLAKFLIIKYSYFEIDRSA